MKISVAIPVYDGMIPARTMNCLFNEQAVAYRIGDELMLNVLHSSAGIAQARNQLATEFLDSQFDRLVFLDSDITWEPGNLLRLAHHPVDYVGGVYRIKSQKEHYPVAWLKNENGTPRELDVNQFGLIEVEGIATGFLSLSRNVFNKFLEKYPERDLTTQNGKKCHAFFTMPFVDGHLYGEDLNFSREWILMGEKIYMDPEIALTHWDFKPTPYPGHIGQYLRSHFINNHKDNPKFKDQFEKIKEQWEHADKKKYGPLSMEESLQQLVEVSEKFKSKTKENLQNALP